MSMTNFHKLTRCLSALGRCRMSTGLMQFKNEGEKLEVLKVHSLEEIKSCR